MNILIVEATYHPGAVHALTDAATAVLERAGARFDRVSVPGVLELPAAIVMTARSPRPFDGYVALGCVLTDNTAAPILYAETIRALTALGAQGFAVGQGVALAASEDAAIRQAEATGGDAARAALALAQLDQRLGLAP